MNALYATPRIALMPLIIIWFGIDLPARIAIIFLSSVFPILVNTMTGVRTIERDFVKVAAFVRRLRQAAVHDGCLAFFRSESAYRFRLGLGHALIGIVVGEMYGASAGIRFMMQTAGATFQTDKVMVGIVIIAAAGMGMTQMLKALEKRVDIWRPDHHL